MHPPTYRQRRRHARLAAVIITSVVAVGGTVGYYWPGGATKTGSPAGSAVPVSSVDPRHAGLPSATGSSAPTGAGSTPPTPPPAHRSAKAAVAAGDLRITSWVYQLQGYPQGRLDALARSPQPLAVIDLARDAASDFFRPDEIARLHRSGKRVLAYFEIGSIENFRPEYSRLRTNDGDLILNRWADWPQEYFVRYWEQRWWDRVVRPRVDQAINAGFDGAYLDTPLAYEEIDLALVPGLDRAALARSMVRLIQRISRYAKARQPHFWIFPQNSPELRHVPGYTPAIDGIGMEELFYLAADRPCTEDFCAENLANARALRRAGKLVLAVDYAQRSGDITAACTRYAKDGFVGYVTVRDLDRISPPCR
jgi:cysteinyl-tRNA synthetase